MLIPRDNTKLDFARYLRKNMTPHERKLWYCYLRNYPDKFYRQRIVGPYIADFFCFTARLVVELDGSQHYMKDGHDHDVERTAYLNKYDIHVLRFPNHEVDVHFVEVCEKINWTVQCRKEMFKQK